MFKPSLIEMFERDLLKVVSEVNAYKNEADIWLIRNEISNSAGNLCLHLIGNLNHFIGATLGNSGYIRTREVEFSAKNVARKEMINSLHETIHIVTKTVSNLNEADFEAEFPLDKHGRRVSTTYMLLHLLTHLNYHLGQINYHRRLITSPIIT